MGAHFVRPEGDDLTRNALILSGPFGLGHEMLSQSCAAVLRKSGWKTRSLDSMSLMGSIAGGAGERLFGRLMNTPGLYDALHFAHLRTGSRWAELMDRRANARLIPHLRGELERAPADLVISVFATGASAAAALKSEVPDRRTVVLCTDVAVHRMWVSEGTDLFLVTSHAAAASVRRFLPRANISIVPPPVRAAFYTAPLQLEARTALNVPHDAPCVLVIDSGWGFGPMVESVATLARSGIHVLAVAGRHRSIEQQLRKLAQSMPMIMPFGFTDRVPELMTAADVIVSLPGATTCSEARVVGRPLLLLDRMPGHGRDNLQHELEMGAAEVCGPTPGAITASARALLDSVARPTQRLDPAPRWEPPFVDALQTIGVELDPFQDAPEILGSSPQRNGNLQPTLFATQMTIRTESS